MNFQQSQWNPMIKGEAGETMDLMEQFEHALPMLQTSIESLVVETTLLGFKGSFHIENVGGGKLDGTIVSNNPCVTFAKRQFNGNKIEMEYTIVLNIYRSGDEIQTSVVIMSNGGEKIIPVLIKVIPAAIETEEGVKITSLVDFYAYVQQFGAKGRELFATAEFETWLNNSGFDRMDIFAHLKKDPNKERVLDNFFVLCNLKEKIELESAQTVLNFEIMPNVAEMLSGFFEVKRTELGFVDEAVVIKHAAKWLELTPKRLTPAAFSGSQTAIVSYKINTGLIDQKVESDHILIGEHIDIKVTVKTKKQMKVSLSKQHFRFGETGLLHCVNNSGKEVVLTIEPNEPFIRFEGRRFIINGPQAQIPFVLKNSAIAAAQMAIKKQPTITGEIVMNATINGTAWGKTLTVTAGDGFIVK